MKMQGSCLLAFGFLAFVCVIKSSTQTKSAAHYWKCRKGAGIYYGNVLKTMTTSYMQCFMACSDDPACKSLNVCPSASSAGQSVCTLMTDVTKWFCRELNTTSPQNKDCFHAEKSSSCGKGHRLLSNGTCRCDLCYRGSTCRHHVRDCQEAYQLAELGGGFGGSIVCNIQPNGAPSPFLAKCALTGPLTTFLVRVQDASGQHWSGIQWATKTWDEYAKGFGSLETYNFFMGLENLHLLLSQAHYRLMIYFQFQPAVPNPCGPAYANVTLGADIANYALNYSQHTICNASVVPGLNGFYNKTVPHRFCTVDRDCGTCARDKGPGWYYNPGCVGYSPFAPIAKWPYFSKGALTISDTQWYLERDGGLASP